MFWAGSAARCRRIASLSESAFWDLTPAEAESILLEALDEWRMRERAAAHNAATICATVANCHRDPKRRKEPFTADDFLPRYERTKPEPTAAEVATRGKAAMKILTKIN